MSENLEERFAKDPAAYLRETGHSHVRQLPDGRWIGLHAQMFTTALMVGLNAYGYEWRCCFEELQTAVDAIEAWDGKGWPPGYWIKAKGLPGGDVRRTDATPENAP